ncbi:MAG: histone deacetylase [Thermoplasmata archaeon]
MSIIYHPIYLKHQQSPMHPESPQRLERIVERLKSENLFNNVLKPEKASEEEIALVHSLQYIDKIKNFGDGYYDPDTYVRKETFEIASVAVGGGILAAEESWKTSNPSFALLRPPGHHACPSRAMGFCYFNNIAIAAKKMLSKTKKVAIIDIDFHHGNGTSDIFYASKDVLYISTHEYGAYPGTGAANSVGSGEGEGYTVNVPFTYGCGDASFKMAFDEIMKPIVTQFEPGIILVSFGGDAHYADTLGSLALSSPGYISLSKDILKLSKEICKGRTAFYLEGGYNVDALAEVVTGTIASFDNKEIKLKYTDNADTDGNGKKIVSIVKEVQKKYWRL